MKMNTIFTKKDYKYIFYNFATILFYIGIFLVILFILIFLIIAIIKGRFDYISFFFHNFKKNIILSILTSLHVFILASGILLIFISFFKMTPIVLVYKDRFEIFEFLQKTKVINFETIKSVNVTITLLRKNLLNKSKKECQILINNPTFNFYLCYPVDGYFDNLIIEKEDDNFTLRKCFTTKDIIKEILNDIYHKTNIKPPFLP